MDGELTVMSSQLKAIQSEVVEFNVGVSHLALDEERERYTRIRERIESIIIALEKSRTSAGKYELENAQRLLTAAAGNTATLRYLESISCLENIFTDVTKAATVTAVGLSTEDGISQRVLASRFLTDNVKQCWDYTAQLSNLAAIHLKSAADFHIFNHEANEVRAHANQLRTISEKQLETFSPDGRIDEAVNLSDEMNERLNAFQSLADRARKLTLKAPSILPVENRLLEVCDGVAKGCEPSGPLLVQMLVDYVGSNFNVRKGDSLPLIDTTESPYLWKVMTSSGPQYIPSIACIIASANTEQIHDAYRTLAAIKDAWNHSLENYKKQLAKYYTKYLQGVGQSRGLYTTDSHGKKRFLDDLNRFLIVSGADEGRLTNILEKLSMKAVSRSEQAEVVWNHSELSLLHHPLLVLSEHVQSLRRIDESVDTYTSRMKGYSSTVTSEARGLQAQLESLRMTHDRNRAELKELYDRVHNWKTVYNASLNGPASGIGRLVISSVSSSSGISSEELPFVPLPPSPLGRITPTELPSTLEEGVEEEEPFGEFLETRQRRRPKMNVAILQAKDEPRAEKSKVFTCGASLHPRQMQANVDVKRSDIQKPKMVRDVATQTPHRRVIQKTQTEMSGELVNCRIASTQSESHKVDCMTQIGWIKAQKAQQVDGSIISAAMEVTESVPSYASALGGVTAERVQETYTTGPSINTTAHCETATSAVKKQDLMFQIGDSRTLIGLQSDTPNLGSSIIETDVQSVDSGAFETHVPSRSLDFEIKKETRDIIAQIKPIVKKVNFGSQPNLQIRTMETDNTSSKTKQKKSEIQVSALGLTAGIVEHKRTLSSVNLQTEIGRTSFLVETASRPLKTYDVEAQIFQASKVRGTHDGMKCYRSASQQTAIDEVKKEAETRDLMRRGEFEGMEKKVRNKNEEYTKGTSYCELDVGNRSLSDIDLQITAPRMAEASINNDKRKLKVAAECTCFEIAPGKMQTGSNLASSYTSCILHQPLSFHFNPPCYAQCETPMRNLDCTTSYSRQTVSCQVGTKLVPKEVKVSAMGVEISDNMVAGRLGLPMNSLLCPASVECHHVLTEDPGIQIVDLKEVGVVNIQTEENTYSAGVLAGKKKSITSTSQMLPREACVIEFGSSYPEINRSNIYFTKRAEDGDNVAPRLLTSAECQFTVNDLIHVTTEHNFSKSWSESTYTTTCGSRRVYSNASCQVGTILWPESMEVSAVPLKLASVDQANHEDMAVDAVICPTRVVIKPVLSESVGINVARIQGLHHMNVKIANRMYDASVAQTPKTQSQQEVVNDRRQVCILEMSSNNRQVDDHTMAVSPNVSEANFTIELNKPKRKQETVDQCSICPTCRCHLETSWTNPMITESSTTRKLWSMASKSTQVGTTLTPTRVQIMEVNVKPKDSHNIRDFSVGVRNVVCPSTVELVSSLSETYGIRVRDISEVDAVTILAEGSASYANVNKVAGATTGSQVRQNCIVGNRENMKPAAKKSDAYVKSEQPLLQQVRLEIVNSKVNELCDFCHGTGKKDSGQVSSQDRRIKSTSSTTYQPIVHQKIGSSAVSSVECQVGAVLRPTRAHLANIEIHPRTGELARQLGMTPSAIICPSTVELQTELADQAGIQVIDVKDAGNMELVAGSSVFETSFRSPLAGTRQENIPSSRPFMRKMNIACGKLGLTLGQVGHTVQNMETFSLQDVGCDFAIKSMNIRTVCNHCGRSEQAQTTFPSFGSTSLDTSRRPSFIHQRASTPLSKTVECQVGMVLRPSCIQIGNIRVKAQNRAIAEYLGMNVESILCPARVQMVPEIREASGIEIINISGVTHTEIQADEVLIDADVQTRRPWALSASTDTQKKSHPLFHLKGSQCGLSIEQSTARAPTQSVATACENFTLNDIGCDVVLRNSVIGSVCKTCQGSGRMTNVSMKPMPKIFKPRGIENSQHYSTLIPSTTVTKSVVSESKSCQVGTVLTPTYVNIAGVEMFPRKATSTELSSAIVYPAAVEVESKITETSGIQIRDIATMDSINVSLGGKSYIATLQQTSKPKTESCVLEVKSFHPEAVRGELSTYRMAVGSLASSGRFNLANIGCEFKLRETITSQSKYMYPSISNLESKRAFETRLRSIAGTQVKHTSTQVGLTLVPTTVQVADVYAISKEPRITDGLGLKADAIICPSTVELETRLTESAGVTVTDVKYVKEVGITVGNKRGVAGVTCRKSGVHEMGTSSKSSEVVYLTFVTRPPSSLLATRPSHTKAFETSASQVSKPFDQKARCTFQIRLMEESQNKYPVSSPKLGSMQESAKTANAGCQVGVTMIPRKMNVLAAKLIVEEKTSADAMGISAPSILQSTTCELESHISEKAGIDIAQINAVEHLQLQVGSEIFNASVVGGGAKPTQARTTGPSPPKYITSITGFPRMETRLTSKAQCVETSTSNATGPYLVKLKEGTIENRSVLEVGSLTLGGRSLELHVDADLRGKLTMQTVQQPTSWTKFTGYLDPSKRLRSPVEPSDRLLPRRPDSRLCDVACEALIKPETLEKRLQTVFI